MGVRGLLPFPRAPPVARSGAASGMRAIRACPGAGGPSLNPIRAPQPCEGARRRAQAPRGGRVRSPGAPAPEGPRAPLSPPPPLPAGSSRPELGLAGHLRFPVPTSVPPTRTDVQILAAPGWVPDLQRSPSSKPPDLLSESTAKARTSVGGGGGDQLAPSLQSPTPATPRLEIEWNLRPPVPSALLGSAPKSSAWWCGIHWLPCAGSSRGIHSQVSGDRSLGSQIGIPPPRRPRAGGRSTRSPPLPRPTLPTFLPGPQPSRNLAAVALRRHPSPFAGGALRADSPPRNSRRPPHNLPCSRRRRLPARRRNLSAACGTCPRLSDPA